MWKRNAMTLVEALVCVAILGILLGLVVVAVQRVRGAGARAQSENNLRQIILGSHNFAAINNGRFPSLDGNLLSAGPAGYGFLVAIRSFIEQENQPPPALDDHTTSYPSLPFVAIYVSPADPSVDRASSLAISSYAVNAQAFQGNPTMQSFRDGTSNTIGIGEHYSTNCGQQIARTGWLWQPGTQVTFGYVLGITELEDQGAGGMVRRASFADGNLNSVVADLATSLGSGCGDYAPGPEAGEFPSLTFQVAPSLSACDPRLPQTPHRSGMLVALADGSCRTISPSITAASFWAAVTPAGAEPLGDDWNW